MTKHVTGNGYIFSVLFMAIAIWLLMIMIQLSVSAYVQLAIFFPIFLGPTFLLCYDKFALRYKLIRER